jgi:hypothetical protein
MDSKDKSRYGSRLGSFRALMDDLFWDGGTEDELVRSLYHCRPPQSNATMTDCTQHIRKHRKYLIEKGILITEGSDGRIKAQKEFLVRN